MSRVLAGIAVAGLAATLVGGCGLATSRYTEKDGIGQDITSIRLNQDAGAVNIRVGGTPSVTRTVHHLDDKPGATHRVEGGALILEGCGLNNCWIDYEVVVPRKVALAGDVASGDVTVEGAVSVDLRTSSGDVDVRGVSGAVSVEANSGRVELADVGENASVQVRSGDVDLRGVRGDATVRSSSGTVTVAGVGGKVDVEATSGDVAVGVSTVSDVRAHANSGAVSVTVPRGRYRMTVDVGSGEVDSAVADDPAGTAALDLAASSGDVTVRYA
ncbi:DUF4097 family beta strand repeat-containing protein [Actinokineospora sp. 24-640]